MGNFNFFVIRLSSLLVLHAVGAGHASPSVLVTRSGSRVPVEFLLNDNQTMYRLGQGERKIVGLNTSSIFQSQVYITISPCTKDFHWVLYYSKTGYTKGEPSITEENSGDDVKTISLNVSAHDKYVLQMSSQEGGAAVVSVRGEPPRQVRMRLRVRSKRRLSASWESSPIDPHSTMYCVVASYRKVYTSLCAAQHDIQIRRKGSQKNHLDQRIVPTSAEFHTNIKTSTEVDNKIVNFDAYNLYEGNFINAIKRRKFSRSTRVTNEDPVIACVGSRTHHMIENLDPNATYSVSVYGISEDRRLGSLLATGMIKAKTSPAKRLTENVPVKADIKGRAVYHFKTTIGSGGGLWLSVSACGGAVNVEVLVRGKRLHMAKNIDCHAKFFVPAPISSSSIQETSEESSVQFDSSSEEARMRYVIKVIPTKWIRDDSISTELTASTTRWGINTPELSEDGMNVRELRQKRSCQSVDIAFLPATHNATDVIRYCIIVREVPNSINYPCWLIKKPYAKYMCIVKPEAPENVIVQKISGLQSDRKYAIQVLAFNKDASVPYNLLYVDTNGDCNK